MFGWFKTKAVYRAEEPNQGGRGMWWVGIIDTRTGKRVFQSAPPGFKTKHEAVKAIALLRHGLQ